MGGWAQWERILEMGAAPAGPPVQTGPEARYGRLRSHRHHAGDRLLSATVLLLITDGRSLDWDPAKAPPSRSYSLTRPRHRPRPPTFPTPSWQGSRPASCRSIAANSRQPRACYLTCVLPLGVAFTWQLTWDGHRVNAYLCRLHEEDFRTEKLRREGRAQFDTACCGCTVDVSAAYHQVHLPPDSIPESGFEWQGHFYRFWCCRSAWPRPR